MVEIRYPKSVLVDYKRYSVRVGCRELGSDALLGLYRCRVMQYGVTKKAEAQPISPSCFFSGFENTFNLKDLFHVRFGKTVPAYDS